MTTDTYLEYFKQPKHIKLEFVNCDCQKATFNTSTSAYLTNEKVNSNPSIRSINLNKIADPNPFYPYYTSSIEGCRPSSVSGEVYVNNVLQNQITYPVEKFSIDYDV